jgi:hypothetical protein
MAWTIDVHAIMRRPKRQQPTTFHSIFETDFSHCGLFFSDTCGTARGMFVHQTSDTINLKGAH